MGNHHDFGHLTRVANENYRPSGRNQTCGHAIPMQRSNQLSYSETVVELCRKLVIYTKMMPMYGVWV